MPDIADPELRAVAAAIARYLQAHRDAADTIDGAARWWLEGDADLETVERALTFLVDEGVVERHTMAEGTTVFRRKQH